MQDYLGRLLLFLRKRWYLALIGLLVLGWLAVRYGESPMLFWQFLIDGLRLGFVYALIALGYTMVYGIVRLINFAHGDVFMVGAYTAYFATTRYHWGVIQGMLLAMAVSAFLGVVIERVAYKPLRNAPRIAALITAVGMSFFLEYFAALDFVFTPNFINYTPLPIKIKVWDVGGVTFSKIFCFYPAIDRFRHSADSDVLSHNPHEAIMYCLVYTIFLKHIVNCSQIFIILTCHQKLFKRQWIHVHS